MSFWKQVPRLTKVYLAVLVYLIVLLLGLVFVRMSNGSIKESSFWKLINRKQSSRQTTTTSAIPVVVPTATFVPGSAILQTNENTPVREGPGDQYPVIAFLENNQSAQITGVSQDKRWWAIDLPYFASGRGWVSANKVMAENANNVQVLALETETPVGEVTPGNGASVMAIANVNVRSGPDTRYMKIGNIAKGQTVEVLGVSEDRYWWLVKLPGTKNVQGWISRDYVVASHTDNIPVIGAQTGVEQTLAPGSPYLVAIMTVNVRAGPDVTYAVVGQLNQGQLAEIVGVTRDGLWWAIKYPAAEGGRGWVAAAYVKSENSGSVPVMK
jgi:uncharacterized protein YraI